MKKIIILFLLPILCHPCFAQLDQATREKGEKLHQAIDSCDINLVEKLASDKKIIEYLNDEEETPLLVALSVGSCDEDTIYKMVTVLLNNNADIKVLHPVYGSVLHYPHANIKDLFEIFIRKGADVNARNLLGDDITPLDLYISDYNRVEFLLNNNANPHLRENFRVEDVEVLKLLLKYHFKVNNTDSQGRTISHVLYSFDEYGQISELIDILVKKRADFNIQDRAGDTPLHTFLKNINSYPAADIACRYIEKGARFDIKNNDGYTALDIPAGPNGNWVYKSGYNKIKQCIKNKLEKN